MNALDQLRTTHRRAQVADQLEQAARSLCDILTGDELEGEQLYDAIDEAVDALADALDTYERPPGERLPAPPPVDEVRSDDVRLCALREVPIAVCTCTACTARRDGMTPTAAAPTSSEDTPAGSILPAVIVGGFGHCPHTGKPSLSCTCPAHVAWRTSGAAGHQTCRTCDADFPIADYPRSGAGWSKDCRACMGRRNAQAHRGKGRRQREHADDKEPV